MENDFYNNAKEEGYSDDEIKTFLFKQDKDYINYYSKAKKEGYSEKDILSFSPEKKEKATEPQKQEFFKEPEKETKSLGQQAKDLTESALRIPAVLGLHAMAGFAWPYELAAGAIKGVQGTDTAKAYTAKRNALDELEMLQENNVNKPRDKWSEQDKDNYDYFKRIVEAPSEDVEELTPPPPDFTISKALQTITGFDAHPRNVFETFTGILGDIYGGGGGEVKDVISLAPVAASSVAAEELFGVPTWASLPVFAGVFQLGKSAWNLGKQGANWLSKRVLLMDPKKISKDMNIKDVQKSMRAEAEKQFSEGVLSAEDYEALQPFFETAEKFGIVVDPASMSKSKRFKRIQKHINKSDATEEQKAAFLQKATESWANSYIRATENIKKTAVFEDENSLIENLASNVTQKKHKALKDKYNSLYEKSEAGFEDAKPISRESTEKIQDALDKVIEKTSGSLFETGAEKETQAIAKGAKEKLQVNPSEMGQGELEQLNFPTGQETGAVIEQEAVKKFQNQPGQKAKMQLEAARKTRTNHEKDVQHKTLEKVRKIFGPDADLINGKLVFRRPLRPAEIVKSVRSLNNTLDWENPQVINLLSDVRKTLIDTLESEYGKSHARALFDLKTANTTFGKSQKLFGQDGLWAKWGLKREAPLAEELNKTLNSVSRFKQFEKDFGRTKEGKDLIDNLKLLKVREKLQPIFAKEYSPGSISNGLLKIERDPMFKYLAPPETKSNLSKLSYLDKRVQQRSASFYRNNDYPDTATDTMAEILSILNPKMWAFKFANKIRKDQVADAYAYVMMNPDITKKMTSIGERAVKMAEQGHVPKSTMDNLREEVMNEWVNIADEVKTVSKSSPAMFTGS